MDFDQTNQGKIMRLLSTELHCFNLILLESNKLLNQPVESFSVDAVTTLVNDRECLINEIAKAEDELRTLNADINEPETSQLLQEIGDISRTLILIDAKILNVLQKKKLQKVQELTKLTDNQDRGEARSNRLEEAKLLDLRL